MILVILQHLTSREKTLEQLARETCWVLSFAGSDVEASFLRECRDTGVTVAGSEAAVRLLDQASIAAAEKYAKFTAEWPSSCIIGDGLNFKRRFTYKDEISYWWLVWASMKDNEASEAFRYLCYFEIVKNSLGKGSFGKCLLLTDDPLWALLVERLCAKMGVGFETTCSRAVRLNYDILRGLGSRVLFFLSTVWKFILFRLMLRRPEERSSKERVAFFTIYPGPLDIKGTDVIERNYRLLPSCIAANSSLESLMLVWWGGRFARGLRTLREWYKRATQRRQVEAAFLEEYLEVSDIWFVLSDFIFVLRYLLMDLFHPGFRESFRYEGINVYELIGTEFGRYFLGSQIPSHLVVARTAARAVKDLNLRFLICYLELYPIARGLYYGAKKGNPGLVTVAYQHANINRLKLWYRYRPEELSTGSQNGRYVETMPVPDKYFFQGSGGMNILVESGYPKERCHLVGSPRYDILGALVSRGLEALQKTNDPESPAEKKRILVVPALAADDARELIDVCTLVCSTLVPCTVLVKPHPDCPVESFVEAAKRRYFYEDVRVVNGDIYNLILDTDMVVTSYSTVGDEAIALNRPVICYAGLRPCMASFIDVPAAPIVRTPDELAASLRGMLFDESFRNGFLKWRDQLVESSFYRLDGKAAERFVSALLGNHARGAAATGG